MQTYSNDSLAVFLLRQKAEDDARRPRCYAETRQAVEREAFTQPFVDFLMDHWVTFFVVAVVLAAGMMGTSRAHADMIVNGTTAQVSEYNPDGSVNAAFWAKGYDLTSLGHDNQGTGGGQWATLIETTGGTPIVLSASHYWPAAPATFANAAGQQFTYVVNGLMRNVGGTDLWLGSLTGPIDPSIHPVAIAPPAQVGQPILSVGYYYRAGQNTIASTQPGLLSWNYNPTAPLSDMLQAWDSGGPTFVEELGALALAGIHDAISGTSSYDTDVTGLVGSINAALASLGIHATVVTYAAGPISPEPTSLALAGIGLAVISAYRFRRRTLG